MEDFIYIVFFVIYIIFAILKKLGEKSAIDKNKTSGPTSKAPSPVKDIFARLEEIKKQQEMAAKQTQQQEPNAAENIERASGEQPAPYSVEARQTHLQAPPEEEPVQTHTNKLNEYASQQNFSYDEMESLEQTLPTAVSHENLSFKEKKESTFQHEPPETDYSYSEFTQVSDLQKAFVWKEVFDKPLLCGSDFLKIKF